MADVRKMYDASRRRFPREVAFVTSPVMRRDVLGILACYFCPHIIPDGLDNCDRCGNPDPSRPGAGASVALVPATPTRLVARLTSSRPAERSSIMSSNPTGYMKKWRKSKRDAGVCYDCKLPASPGKSRCPTHARQHTENELRRRRTRPATR